MYREKSQAISGEYVLGRKIPLKNSWHRIAVTKHGEVVYYLGKCTIDEYGFIKDDFRYLPKVEWSETQEKIFIRLNKGNLFLDEYLRKTEKYEIIDDHYVFLPHTGRRYYGVFAASDAKENLYFTRELFGITFWELSDFTKIFSNTIMWGSYYNYPRVTYSTRKSNRCDITGVWIPKGFPYISIGSYQYDQYGLHISLTGFYRLVTFLCGGIFHKSSKPKTKSCNLLIDSGVDREVFGCITVAGYENEKSIFQEHQLW